MPPPLPAGKATPPLPGAGKPKPPLPAKASGTPPLPGASKPKPPLPASTGSDPPPASKPKPPLPGAAKATPPLPGAPKATPPLPDAAKTTPVPGEPKPPLPESSGANSPPASKPKPPLPSKVGPPPPPPQAPPAPSAPAPSAPPPPPAMPLDAIAQAGAERAAKQAAKQEASAALVEEVAKGAELKKVNKMEVLMQKKKAAPKESALERAQMRKLEAELDATDKAEKTNVAAEETASTSKTSSSMHEKLAQKRAEEGAQPGSMSTKKAEMQKRVEEKKRLKAQHEAEQDAASATTTAASTTDTAATRKKTRGALLGGLRSGALEKAVAKMEEDTADVQDGGPPAPPAPPPPPVPPAPSAPAPPGPPPPPAMPLDAITQAGAERAAKQEAKAAAAAELVDAIAIAGAERAAKQEAKAAAAADLVDAIAIAGAERAAKQEAKAAAAEELVDAIAIAGAERQQKAAIKAAVQSTLVEMVPMFDEAKKYLQKVETVDKSAPMWEGRALAPQGRHGTESNTRMDEALELALASPTQQAVPGAGRRQELSPVARTLSLGSGITDGYLGNSTPSSASIAPTSKARLEFERQFDARESPASSQVHHQPSFLRQSKAAFASTELSTARKATGATTPATERAEGAASALQAALNRPPPASPRSGAHASWTTRQSALRYGRTLSATSPRGRASRSSITPHGRFQSGVTSSATEASSYAATPMSPTRTDSAEMQELRQMMIRQSQQLAAMSSQLRQLAPEEAEPPEDAATLRTRAEISAVLRDIQQARGEDARQLAVHQNAGSIAAAVDFLLEILTKTSTGDSTPRGF